MLNTIRLLFDFGVVVLIWLVQLVIYPSFRYMPEAVIRSWHPKYTFLVSLVVMPLMLGQLAVAGYQLFRSPDLYTITSAVLIAIAWGLTFFYAVPLHNGMGSAEDHLPLAERLIFINALRTVAWSGTFLLSVYFLMIK